MKDIIKVIDVWIIAEKAFTLSAHDNYPAGLHEGRIEAFERVKELIAIQPQKKGNLVECDLDRTRVHKAARCSACHYKNGHALWCRGTNSNRKNS